MSDFDEEAERERLREQYERDQAEREATEKMSELLLQGATMTNAHCSDCGDPIFRYDGQEFCATCEKAVDRDGADEAADADETGEDAAGADADGQPPTDGEHIEVTAPDETGVQFGGDGQSPEADAAPDQAQDAAPEPAQGEGADTPADARTDDRSAEPAPGAPTRTPQHPRDVPGVDSATDDPDRHPPADTPARRPRAGGDAAGTGDLATARAALERTLARLSRQAEAAEDPAQAREYLAAAREAAETLAALRG